MVMSHTHTISSTRSSYSCGFQNFGDTKEPSGLTYEWKLQHNACTTETNGLLFFHATPSSGAALCSKAPLNPMTVR